MLERLVQLGYRVTVLLRVDSDTTRIDHLLVSPLVTTTSSELMEEIFVNNPPYIVIHMATCYRKYHAAVDIDDMIVSNVTLPTQIAQLCVTY